MILIATKNIIEMKIIHERTISEDDLQAIKDMIKEASRIFFLGFGYARENLRMIGIPAILNGDQSIYGTAFNFTDKEIFETRTYLNKYFKIKNPQLENPRIFNVDSRRLLRDYL